MSFLVRVAGAFSVAFLLLAGPAGAITFAPGAAFLPDDGSELFDPVTSPRHRYQPLG